MIYVAPLCGTHRKTTPRHTSLHSLLGPRRRGPGRSTRHDMSIANVHVEGCKSGTAANFLTCLHSRRLNQFEGWSQSCGARTRRFRKNLKHWWAPLGRAGCSVGDSVVFVTKCSSPTLRGCKAMVPSQVALILFSFFFYVSRDIKVFFSCFY